MIKPGNEFNSQSEDITDARENTSFCGLYCRDCIPSNEELFSLLKKLKSVLATSGFENYAALKAARDDCFRDYPVFLQVLESMLKLECRNGCYRGPLSELGCKSDCAIRTCVIEHKYNGCWDCNIFMTCELLDQQKKVHPSLENNLNCIRRHGIGNWIEKRGKHYIWQS